MHRGASRAPLPHAPPSSDPDPALTGRTPHPGERVRTAQLRAERDRALAALLRAEQDRALAALLRVARDGERIVVLSGPDEPDSPDSAGRNALLDGLVRGAAPQLRVVRLAGGPLEPRALCASILRRLGATPTREPIEALRATAKALRAAGSGLLVVVDDLAALPSDTTRWLGGFALRSGGGLRLAAAAWDDRRSDRAVLALGVPVDVIRYKEPARLPGPGNAGEGAPRSPSGIPQRFPEADPAPSAPELLEDVTRRLRPARRSGLGRLLMLAGVLLAWLSIDGARVAKTSTAPHSLGEWPGPALARPRAVVPAQAPASFSLGAKREERPSPPRPSPSVPAAPAAPTARPAARPRPAAASNAPAPRRTPDAVPEGSVAPALGLPIEAPPRDSGLHHARSRRASEARTDRCMETAACQRPLPRRLLPDSPPDRVRRAPLVPDPVDLVAADLAAAALVSGGLGGDPVEAQRALARLEELDRAQVAATHRSTGLTPVSRDLVHATLGGLREYREASDELLDGRGLDPALRRRLELFQRDDFLALADARIRDARVISFGRAFNAVAEPVGRSIMTSALAPYRLGRALLKYALELYAEEPLTLQRRQALSHWKQFIRRHPDAPEVEELVPRVARAQARWNRTHRNRSVRDAQRLLGEDESRMALVHTDRALRLAPEDDRASRLRDEAARRILSRRRILRRSVGDPPSAAAGADPDGPLADDIDTRAFAQSTYLYRGMRERYGLVRARESILPFDIVIQGSLTDLSIGAFPRIRKPRETPDAFLYR